MQKKLRKIMIVVEENGVEIKDGKGPNGGPSTGFNCRLAGDTERITDGVKITPQVDINELTAAEFWGMRLFQICTQVLRDTGAAK